MNKKRTQHPIVSRLLKHPWWLGLTGLITIATLIVAMLQLAKPDPKPAPPPPPVPLNEITGDCNAQGNNNEISCSYKVFPPAPLSIGDVEIGWAGHATFFFDGIPSELPKPPDYPTHEVRNHCDEWEGWLAGEQRIYTMQPQVWMSILSGKNDQVVVTRVEPTVFTKRPIGSSFTVLQCQYGADGIPGSILTVDVGTGKTTLLDQTDKDPQPQPMPPAAMVLNGSGYDGAIVRVESTTGFLYSGRIRVTAKINGKEQKIDFGTPDKPFRWIGGQPEQYPKMPNDARYDWNPKTLQWIQNLNPDDVHPS
ncbi:hypothetical protein ACFQ68_16645 [Amycolatopsis japonica]|uniref:hypothetical protein n=1 Tax=Amycolatopsis japonica TaxID=208439 RepID=UPI00366FE722